MLFVSMYQVLGEAVVTVHSVLSHDGSGNLVPPTDIALAYSAYDVSGALGARDVGLMLGDWTQRNERRVAEQFGGWHNLL